MPQHACHHARNPGDTFEEDEPRDPLLLCHRVACVEGILGWWLGPVAGDKVHAPAQDSHGPKGDSVLPVSCLTMGCTDGEDLLSCVSGE